MGIRLWLDRICKDGGLGLCLLCIRGLVTNWMVWLPTCEALQGILMSASMTFESDTIQKGSRHLQLGFIPRFSTDIKTHNWSSGREHCNQGVWHLGGQDQPYLVYFRSNSKIFNTFLDAWFWKHGHSCDFWRNRWWSRPSGWDHTVSNIHLTISLGAHNILSSQKISSNTHRTIRDHPKLSQYFGDFHDHM